MKKFIILGLMLAIVSIMATGCSSCQSENKKQGIEVKMSALTPETSISTDREYMAIHQTTDYRWYETAIVLKDYLDAENPTATIQSVDNVFQVATADASGGDSEVFIFSHSDDGIKTTTYKGFWIEDCPLNEEAIKLTFKQAYEMVMETNSPKPHSRKCVLRLPVGPKPCNAQWCFGNIHEQLWVDAVTGEVRNFNPAFDVEGSDGGLPLNQN